MAFLSVVWPASGKQGFAAGNVTAALLWFVSSIYYIAGALGGIAGGVWDCIVVPLLSPLISWFWPAKVQLKHAVPATSTENAILGISTNSDLRQDEPNGHAPQYKAAASDELIADAGNGTPLSQQGPPAAVSGPASSVPIKSPSANQTRTADPVGLSGGSARRTTEARAPSEGGTSVQSNQSTGSRSGRPRALAGSTAVPGSGKHKTGSRKAGIR